MRRERRTKRSGRRRGGGRGSGNSHQRPVPRAKHHAHAAVRLDDALVRVGAAVHRRRAVHRDAGQQATRVGARARQALGQPEAEALLACRVAQQKLVVDLDVFSAATTAAGALLLRLLLLLLLLLLRRVLQRQPARGDTVLNEARRQHHGRVRERRDELLRADDGRRRHVRALTRLRHHQHS